MSREAYVAETGVGACVAKAEAGRGASACVRFEPQRFVLHRFGCAGAPWVRDAPSSGHWAAEPVLRYPQARCSPGPTHCAAPSAASLAFRVFCVAKLLA